MDVVVPQRRCQSVLVIQNRKFTPELMNMPSAISKPEGGQTPPLGSHNLVLSLFQGLLRFVLRRTTKRTVRSVLLVALVITAVGMAQAKPAFAAGVVGNGTPGSCTEAAFDAVLASQADNIKFNCGSAAKTIVLTTTKDLTWTTTINGGNKIILQAKKVPHFFMAATKSYTLKNITLKDGSAEQGGALTNNGTLTLQKVRFENNKAANRGGAIQNGGTLIINKSVFAKNRAKTLGGVIYNYAGTMTITDTTFSENSGTDKEESHGGAIYSESGILVLQGGTFTKNSAAIGSALDIYTGQLNANGTAFTENNALIGATVSLYDAETWLENITVDRNRAIYAAGIGGNGHITIKNSTISNNIASYSAGGIGTDGASDGGLLRLENSTVTGNTAQYGGGLFLGIPFEIINSTISNNRATKDGGGAFVWESGTLANSTISGNSAAKRGGGWLQSYNNTDFYFVTVANNKATKGGGVITEIVDFPALQQSTFTKRGTAVLAPLDEEPTLHIQNSLLAKNSGGNCKGTSETIGTRGNNLSDDDSCTLYFDLSTDLNKVNAKLGPLANNGGPTLTHLPLKGSKAIDHGWNLGGYLYDQRGVLRPSNVTSDIGAVEVEQATNIPAR